LTEASAAAAALAAWLGVSTSRWPGSEPALAKSRYKALQSAHSPETSMTDSTPRYGFVAFAETWNGRLAMLGFVIGLGTELLTGQSILSQIGLG
jgi:ferrochelatase